MTFTANDAYSVTGEDAAKNRTAIVAGATATSDNTVGLGSGCMTEV